VRRALTRERELSELKTRFVSLASHEFRTPLAAILSSIELIEDFGATLAEGERSELIRTIKGAISRMTGMLDQVMLIGRAEADRLEFRPEATDAAALAAALVRETEQVHGQLGRIEMRARGSPARAPRSEAPRPRAGQPALERAQVFAPGSQVLSSSSRRRPRSASS
jgi:signal transduction histidine kinase